MNFRDRAIGAVEVELRDRDRTQQRDRLFILWIGRQRGLQLVAGLLIVVVREKILGRRHVRGPIAAIDHVVRVNEAVQDCIVQRFVILIFAVELRPAIQGPAEERDVLGAVELERLAAAGLKFFEKFLWRIHEPRILLPRGGKIANLLADRRQIIMPRQRLGILLDNLFEKCDCIGSFTAFRKQICPQNLDARIIRRQRVDRLFRATGCGQRPCFDQRDFDGIRILRLRQRHQRQLVSTAERLQPGLVQVVVIGRIFQLREVFRKKWLEPFSGNRVAGKILAEGD